MLGQPVVGYVLDAVETLKTDCSLLVTCAAGPAVTDYLANRAGTPITLVDLAGAPTSNSGLVSAVRALPQPEGTVVVLGGDIPLLRPSVLEALVTAHESTGAAATMLTLPHGAPDPAEGCAVLAVDTRFLTAAVNKLATEGRSATTGPEDVLRFLQDEHLKVAMLPVADALDLVRCVEPIALAQAGLVLRQRINDAWLRSGVRIVEPQGVWIDATVHLEAGALLEPGVILRGCTSVAAHTVIGPDTTLIDTKVRSGAHVLRTHAVESIIGEGASVGPFAHLRPGTKLGEDTRIGTFVEVKETTVGNGTQVAHLAYVGNATIGTAVNIGAGTTFTLYDGVRKHSTKVGDAAFIGCQTSLVAPVEIGAGAFTAAGSVITQDVPPGALAVERGEQRNVAGWVARRRAGTPWAAAAAAARGTTIDDTDT
nr:NTP transferase domain-containing protein [Streptomyces sp. SID10853]